MLKVEMQDFQRNKLDNGSPNKLIKLFKITKKDKSINNKNEVDINIEILAQPLESPYDTLGRIQ